MDDLFIIGKARFEFAADCAVVFAEGGMRFDLKGVLQPFDKRLHARAFETEAAPAFSTSTVFHFYDRTDEPHRVIDYPQAQAEAQFVDGDNVPEPYAAYRAEFEAAEPAPPADDAHTLGAQVFTQGDSPEEQAAKAKGGLPAEWINLLGVASDPRPGFNFWDAGTFTFGIHQKDLALGDFSRVHDSLESS